MIACQYAHSFRNTWTEPYQGPRCMPSPLTLKAARNAPPSSPNGAALQRVLTSIGPAKPPADLGLRLRVAISQEKARTTRRRIEAWQLYWENTLSPVSGARRGRVLPPPWFCWAYGTDDRHRRGASACCGHGSHRRFHHQSTVPVHRRRNRFARLRFASRAGGSRQSAVRAASTTTASSPDPPPKKFARRWIICC